MVVYPNPVGNCTEINAQMLVCNGHKYTLGDHLDSTDSTQFYIDIGVVGGLVLLAGIMSGLTMGLMSMDKLNLKILANGADPVAKKHASKILPLVERHHLLLVTLLLCNAACAEALPIFLDRLVHPAIAIVLSVTLVLLFGEIIPQAVCTRFGLQIGSALSWFVWFLIIIILPVAWPIAKLLDALLGKDTGTFFRRAELKELVHLHADDEQVPEGESLTIDEVRIIKGAIDMKEKTVGLALTDIHKVFAVDINATLTRDLLQQIVDAGHDRVPIFHNTRDHFIGMILVKDLVLVDPNANVPVSSIKMYRVPMVGADMPLYDMLHQFQTGRSHMSIVLDENDHITPKGIITLEDVIEELLQEEIFDEDDIRRQTGGSGDPTQQNDRLVAHDMRLAKAFLPRKYSLAPNIAAQISPYTRKPSMMVSGTPTGAPTNPFNRNRRTTMAVPSTVSGSSFPSHIVNVAPPFYGAAPPNNLLNQAMNNPNVNINIPNHHNNSEHTPLLPGGKGGN